MYVIFGVADRGADMLFSVIDMVENRGQ